MQFLRTPFKAKALDIQMSADFYFRNGLRIIGTRVGASPDDIRREVTKLKGRLNLSPALAAHAGIRLGYAAPSDIKSVMASLDRLSDPKTLLLSEIFWVPLEESGPEWQQIRSRKSLQDFDLDRLRSLAKLNSDIRATQALAVALHNRAIAADCEYAVGRSGALPSGQPWEEALHWWSVLLSSNAFWANLDNRIAAINHINLRREHLDQLRRELPGVILGFNEAFAQHYALSRNGSGAASNLGALQKHLASVSASAFDGLAKRRALSAMAGEVIQNGLASAASEFDAALAARSGFIELPHFRPLADRLLDAMEASYQMCREQFTLGTSVFEWCTFDTYCEKLQKATNKRIEWKGDNGLWEKKIYYGAVVFDRMLALPLSAGLRASIADDRNKHLEHLWGSGGKTVENGDRWRQCWFVPGQPADLDAVLLFPYYRIVKEDMFSAEWRSRFFLVPRSSVGKDFHAGKIKASKLLEDMKVDPVFNRRLTELNQRRQQGIAVAGAHRDDERTRLRENRAKAVLERDAAQRRIGPILKRNEEEKRKAEVLRDARVRQSEIEREAGQVKADAQRQAQDAEIRRLSLFYRVVAFPVIRKKRMLLAQEHSMALDRLYGDRDRKKQQAEKDYDLEIKRLDTDIAADKRKSGVDAAEKTIATIDSSSAALDAAYEQEVRKCETAFEDAKAGLAPKIRPEKEWKEFPPFQPFISDGFKEGQRPPEKKVDVQREMQRLMQRLSSMDRQMLQMLFQQNQDLGAAVVMEMIQNPRIGVLDAMKMCAGKRGR